eukprot:COSAG06_NODE_8117_length_2269_cov_1.963594_2_plen_89_part_00
MEEEEEEEKEEEELTAPMHAPVIARSREEEEGRESDSGWQVAGGRRCSCLFLRVQFCVYFVELVFDSSLVFTALAPPPKSTVAATVPS